MHARGNQRMNIELDEGNIDEDERAINFHLRRSDLLNRRKLFGARIDTVLVILSGQVPLASQKDGSCRANRKMQQVMKWSHIKLDNMFESNSRWAFMNFWHFYWLDIACLVPIHDLDWIFQPTLLTCDTKTNPEYAPVLLGPNFWNLKIHTTFSQNLRKHGKKWKPRNN